MTTSGLHFKHLGELSTDQRRVLVRFIDAAPGALAYHTLEYNAVVDEAFGYENRSLAAFDAQGRAVGFCPQWRRGRVLESVPWRDKGGPLAASGDAARALAERCVREASDCAGAVWRNAVLPGLETRHSLVNVTVGLAGMDRERFLAALSFKVRGKVTAARRQGLEFTVHEHGDRAALDAFYALFVARRRLQGVPVYAKEVFLAHFRHLRPDQIKLCSVQAGGGTVGAIVLLLHGGTAIDAYSATAPDAARLKASDFMVFEALVLAMELGCEVFDFGADSPRQESLIAYKKKWMGTARPVPESVHGAAPERDHNAPCYAAARAVLRRLPLPLYALVSRLIVR